MEPSVGKKSTFVLSALTGFIGMVQNLVDGKPNHPTRVQKIGNVQFHLVGGEDPVVTNELAQISHTTSNTTVIRQTRNIFGTELFKEDGKGIHLGRIPPQKTRKI